MADTDKQLASSADARLADHPEVAPATPDDVRLTLELIHDTVAAIIPRAEQETVEITVSVFMRISVLSLCVVGLACSQPPRPSDIEANAGIDSLNARISQAYRSHDAKAYAALYTDTAVFEWPAFNTVRGSAGLAAMAQSNWASLRDMDLRLAVSSRRIAPDHATEFGAFQQSYRDSSGARSTEFGRYVAFLVRQGDGSWRMDRFFGFEDSTVKK